MKIYKKTLKDMIWENNFALQMLKEHNMLYTEEEHSQDIQNAMLRKARQWYWMYVVPFPYGFENYWTKRNKQRKIFIKEINKQEALKLKQALEDFSNDILKTKADFSKATWYSGSKLDGILSKQRIWFYAWFVYWFVYVKEDDKVVPSQEIEDTLIDVDTALKILNKLENYHKNNIYSKNRVFGEKKWYFSNDKEIYDIFWEKIRTEDWKKVSTYLTSKAVKKLKEIWLNAENMKSTYIHFKISPKSEIYKLRKEDWKGVWFSFDWFEKNILSEVLEKEWIDLEKYFEQNVYEKKKVLEKIVKGVVVWVDKIVVECSSWNVYNFSF